VVSAHACPGRRSDRRDDGSTRPVRAALACIVLLLAAVAASPASARVRVEVDRDPVVADESFTVTFTVDTSEQSEPDFAPLEKDFDILGRSSQTSLQIINGRPASRQSWVVNLIAKRSGRVVLPAIAFGLERSEALMLDVLPASQGASADGDVYITVQATPQPAYVQAQIVVTVRLYVGVQVGSASLSELTAPDAIVEKLGDDRRRQEMRDGRIYTVFERRYAVFAERSGTLTLGSVEFAGELLGRGFFGRYKRTASEPMDLRIEPAPPDLVPWLPASEVTLTEQWPQDPPVFRAGEPLTRTITLAAKGLTAAQLPPLGGGVADGFKQYADQPALSDKATEDGVTGVREEKVAFLPTQPGRYTLAPIEVAWWDTDTQSVRIVRVPEREVAVLPGATADPAVPGAPAASEPGAQAGVPAGAAGVAAGWPGRRMWLAAVAALGLGWLLTAAAWWWSSRRRRTERRHAEARSSPSAELDAARRRLRAACKRDDPAAAQGALLAWAQARWPAAGAGAWHELRIRSGEPLARELDALERARYGPQPERWSGEGLWRSFSAEALEAGSKRIPKEALLPLHPDAT
jgi:hypothetical protein